jgi:hypothetical protein
LKAATFDFCIDQMMSWVDFAQLQYSHIVFLGYSESDQLAFSGIVLASFFEA